MTIESKYKGVEFDTLKSERNIMALDKDSVKLGISILKKINKGASVVKYENFDRKTACVDIDKIYCVDEKYDDGYENVFTNIENMTPEQIEIWDQLKKEVPNTSFRDKLEEKDYPSSAQWIKEKDRNITCIGWF